MRISCPHCSSRQVIELSLFDSFHSCSGACATTFQALLQSDAVAPIRPPSRRRIGIRVLVFFLAASFLAWPIDLLFTHHLTGTHNQAAAVEFHGLPVLDESNGPATSPAGFNDAVPDLPTVLLLLGCSLALISALALNLHRARQFNQTIWGPALERWNHSRYCVECMSVFTDTEIQADSEPSQSFSSAHISSSAA